MDVAFVLDLQTMGGGNEPDAGYCPSTPSLLVCCPPSGLSMVLCDG